MGAARGARPTPYAPASPLVGRLELYDVQMSALFVSESRALQALAPVARPRGDLLAAGAHRLAHAPHVQLLEAERVEGDPCRWRLAGPAWSAELLLEREDLVVIWQQPDDEPRRCALPYGLSRADVDAAIQAGP